VVQFHCRFIANAMNVCYSLRSPKIKVSQSGTLVTTKVKKTLRDPRTMVESDARGQFSRKPVRFLHVLSATRKKMPMAKRLWHHFAEKFDTVPPS
jgi:hypothetical protein